MAYISGQKLVVKSGPRAGQVVLFYRYYGSGDNGSMCIVECVDSDHPSWVERDTDLAPHEDEATQ